MSVLQCPAACLRRARNALDAAGVRVAALSVDDEQTATALVEKHHLGFPVGYGADVESVAAAIGAYVNDEPLHLQSTGFVLGRDGTVVTAVYSSAAIGRLVPEDVIGLVCYLSGRG